MFWVFVYYSVCVLRFVIFVCLCLHKLQMSMISPIKQYKFYLFRNVFSNVLQFCLLFCMCFEVCFICQPSTAQFADVHIMPNQVSLYPKFISANFAFCLIPSCWLFHPIHKLLVTGSEAGESLLARLQSPGTRCLPLRN